MMSGVGGRRFAFQLAEHLHMTVGEMLARMSSQEYGEWGAYFQWKAIQEEMAR